MKKILIIVVIIVLVTLGFGYYQKYGNIWHKDTPVPTPSSGVINIEGGRLPDGLPKDIVFEKDIQVLHSYYTRPLPYDEDLRLYKIQSSFRFVSQNQPDNNLALYKEYARTNKWEVDDLIDGKNNKRLSVVKGPNKLNLHFYIDSTTKQSIVDIFNINIGLYSSLNKTSTTPSISPSGSR